LSHSVIVAGARTPIGKFSSAFSPLSAQDLGAIAIRGAVGRAGVNPSTIDAVLMGQVIQAGQGQVTARQAANGAGVPLTVNATTLNKACLSSLQAIYMADLMIRAGEADIVVAGGMESMTNAPYLLVNARAGFRAGDQTLNDALMHDGLNCALEHCAMGVSTERYNAGRISRERQDEFSARSHQLAGAATAKGYFDEEIVEVSVPGRRGAAPTVVCADEGVRVDTTTESLAALRPAFVDAGTITAGNSSQISDGAAAVIVMSLRRASELGLKPLGEIVSYGQVAGPDPSLLFQPSGAIRVAAMKAGLAADRFDLYEINEAFAVVSLTTIDDLGLDPDKVNVNGGAVALGHPVGMTGARLALTALLALHRRGGGAAAVGICGGGGQGDAVILRSL
jgi:acetyl-CoA C-acetyltransferase